MGFQRTVNNQPAPAVAGDFASANPRVVVLAGPGQFQSPEGGLTIGNFAWANPDTGVVSQSYVAGYQLGFLHRENQGIITQFLGESTMVVAPGFMITLFSQGEFWAEFEGGATPGQLVYARPSDGAPIAGGSTAPATDAFTASAGFSGTAAMGASFTGEITTNVLTASALTGYLTPGDILAGVGVTPGTVLGAQLTGTPGAAGTYTVTHGDLSSVAMTTTSTVLVVSAVLRGALQLDSIPTGGGLAASRTVTAFLAGTGGVGRYTISGAAQSSASGTKLADTNVMDVTAVSSGVIAPGDVLGAPPATAGTQVVVQLTGTPGGIGTYRISAAQNFASGAVGVAGIATAFRVNSLAAAGELAKISTWG